MRQITWTNKNNKIVTVIIDIKAVPHQINDDTVSSNKYDVLTSIIAEIEGLGIVGKQYDDYIQTARQDGITHHIGKLGISADNYTTLQNAIKEEKEELLKNEGYANYLAKCKKNQEDAEIYYANYDKIANAMRE